MFSAHPLQPTVNAPSLNHSPQRSCSGMDKDGAARGCPTALQIPSPDRPGLGSCGVPLPGCPTALFPVWVLLCPLSHGCAATAPDVSMAQVFPRLQHPWEDEGKDFGC